MAKQKNIKRVDIYHYLLLIILIIAVGTSSGWNFNSIKKDERIMMNLELAREIFHGVKQVVTNNENVYTILSKSDTLGLAILVADNFGFGGRVPVLIGLVRDTIVNVVLLPNKETPEFIDYINEDKLLHKWHGMHIVKVLNTKVDAVSGATESSIAIIRSVRQGVAQYMNKEQNSLSRGVWSIAKDILFLLLIFLALAITYIKSIKKYRKYYILLVFLIIGILTGKVLSIKLLHGWLATGISWQTNWQSLLLLALALIMPLLKKPQFYCIYLCPMGALQELINRISPQKTKDFRLKWQKVPLNEVYLTLIWASLILGFSFELSYFEPFMVFMFRVAGIIFFAFALIIVLLSLFFTKPWCAVCPTGCLLNVIHKNN